MLANLQHTTPEAEANFTKRFQWTSSPIENLNENIFWMNVLLIVLLSLMKIVTDALCIFEDGMFE